MCHDPRLLCRRCVSQHQLEDHIIAGMCHSPWKWQQLTHTSTFFLVGFCLADDADIAFVCLIMQVFIDSQASNVASSTFSYVTPLISSISLGPSGAPAAGGTLLTVVGTRVVASQVKWLIRSHLHRLNWHHSGIGFGALNLSPSSRSVTLTSTAPNSQTQVCTDPTLITEIPFPTITCQIPALLPNTRATNQAVKVSILGINSNSCKILLLLDRHRHQSIC